MNIAHIAPLYERVPPKLYGGTERVVSYLTEELVQSGHNVVLFASGDSVTSAELVAPCQQSLRLDPTCIDPLAYHMIMVDQVFHSAPEFDSSTSISIIFTSPFRRGTLLRTSPHFMAGSTCRTFRRFIVTSPACR